MNPKTGPMFLLGSCVAEAGKGKRGMQESHGEIRQVLWQGGPKGTSSDYVFNVQRSLDGRIHLLREPWSAAVAWYLISDQNLP